MRKRVVHLDPHWWQFRRRLTLWRWWRSECDVNVTVVGKWPSAKRVVSFDAGEETNDA